MSKPVSGAGNQITLIISAGESRTVTHNVFAVFVERCLHKESSQSEAQSVVSVPDAGLPARGAGLQQT